MGSFPLLGGLAERVAEVPGGRLLFTGPRVARWALGSMFQRGVGPAGRPRPVPTANLTAHVALDELVLGTMAGLEPTPGADEIDRTSRAVAAAAELAESRGWVADPASYHRDPPTLTSAGVEIRRARWMHNRYEMLTFESGFAPWPFEPGAEVWDELAPNDVAPVRIVRGDVDRPWLICLHGFGMGYPSADLVCFGPHRLHRELGLNVAMPVLPMHGPRHVPGHGRLLSQDFVLSVQGLAQAVWDVRRVISWIRSQTDAPISLYGVSLGAYVSALVSGVQPVDAVIAGVPAVDFPDLFTHHARRPVVSEGARMQYYLGCLRMAFEVVSPLRFTPRVEHGRRAIFAALGDRFVPEHHAIELWAAWDEPAIRWYPGGHVGFMWSPKVREFVSAHIAGA